MTMDLTKRLTDTLDHYQCLGRDNYGEKTFADPVTYKCLLEGKKRIIRDREGEQVRGSTTSQLTLYIVQAVIVSYDDEVTFRGVRYPVATFENYKGYKAGMDLTVVYL
jgi:hypothetical protein